MLNFMLLMFIIHNDSQHLLLFCIAVFSIKCCHILASSSCLIVVEYYIYGTANFPDVHITGKL